jgi:hypothetical protein
MLGGSNGGHNTKMMVEDYPSHYDVGLTPTDARPSSSGCVLGVIGALESTCDLDA